MKQTKGFQIWQIIYPVGLYYVVSSLCYFALEILLGSADETYMLRQLVGDAVTIPVILKFYMADQNIRDTVYGKKKFRFSSEQAINIAVTCCVRSGTWNCSQQYHCDDIINSGIRRVPDCKSGIFCRRSSL